MPLCYESGTSWCPDSDISGCMWPCTLGLLSMRSSRHGNHGNPVSAGLPQLPHVKGRFAGKSLTTNRGTCPPRPDTMETTEPAEPAEPAEPICCFSAIRSDSS